MDSLPSLQLWREDVGAAPRRAPRWGGGRGARFLVLAALLAVGGALAGLLTWVRPVPNPAFVFLASTTFTASPIPSLPQVEGDRAGLKGGQYFARFQSPAPLDGGHWQQAMASWKNHPARDPLVVYVAGRAGRTSSGEVVLLPADASLDQTGTWLRLRELLEKLRDCPARHKLLILDLMHAWAEPAVGVAADQVAAALPGELRTVTDPNRLVLASCSPGQNSLVAENLGRSVFGYYLEEGLRGYADGYTGQRDGLITVGELARFVRGRVERWAGRLHGERQTPTLYGSGPDFPLVALAHRQAQPHLDLAEAGPYPAWLHAAWKQRDQLWQDGGYRRAPRLFQKYQALLLRAEKAWRDGSPAVEFQSPLERVHQDLLCQRDFLRPAPQSLAQAQRQGLKSDPAVAQALRNLCLDARRLLAGAGREEATLVQARLVKSFAEKHPGVSAEVVAAAAFSQAVTDGASDADTLRLLDHVANIPSLSLWGSGKGEGEPRFVETLLLRQLADLADRLGSHPWPADTASRLLRLAHLAEQVHSQAEAFAWLRPWLDEAAQIRHEGEMALWARGFASLPEADQHLRTAAARYEDLGRQAEAIRQALAARDEALALLPWYARYLEEEPKELPAWEAALASTRALDAVLRAGPMSPADDSLPPLPVPLARLKEKVGVLKKKTQELTTRLAEFQAPFDADHVARLVALSRQPRVPASLLREMNRLLTVPHPRLTADRRRTLVQALRQGARRLQEEIRHLDHDEDGRKVLTAAPADNDDPAALQEERQRALRRAHISEALFTLVDLAPNRVQVLQEGVTRARKNPQALPALGPILRRLWTQDLKDHFLEEGSLETRQRLSWLAPPLEAFAPLDEAERTPTMTLRARQARELYAWLNRHYLYLARDYRHSGLPAGVPADAGRFYLQAAAANGGDLAPATPLGHVEFAVAQPPRLEKPALAAVTTLQVKRFMPTGTPSAIELQVTSDRNCWQVTPDRLTLPEVVGAAAASVDTHSVPLRIALTPQTPADEKTRPQGFILQARYEGRTFHYLVPVIVPSGDDWKIWLSANAKEPVPVDEVRVRPGGAPHPFYLFVHNPTAKPRAVVVKLLAGEHPIKGGQGTLTLQAKELRRLALDEIAPVNAGFAGIHGPLRLQLVDAETRAILVSRVLPVKVLDPRDYVHVSEIRFAPGQRLSVKLEARGVAAGPAIPAELVLPGLKGPGRGTFRGEIAVADKAGLHLFADNPHNPDGTDPEGTVYVHVDGVPRAVIFRNLVGPASNPSALGRDDRPAVRLSVPSFLPPRPTLSFPIEVDNPPPGSTLEISLGTLEANTFAAEQTRTFADAKHRPVRLNPHGPDGALVFQADVKDWTVTFNAATMRGRRALQARLLDAKGQEIRQTLQVVICDDTPPTDLKITGVPARAKQGTTLVLTAQAQDGESPIAAVEFFAGKPVNGQIPPRVFRLAAHPDLARKNWTARFPLPDNHRGPFPISVRAVNAAGLATFTSTLLLVTEIDPALLVPGKIRGTVTEGARPQPNLLVILRDAKGKELARTKTLPDGTYSFDNLSPGRYQVFSFKPESRRQAAAGAVVEPGKTTAVPLPLSF